MELVEFSNKTKHLIDAIKGICNDAGLGGDANEYKIVTQGFLYKFLNDKFLYEVAKLNPAIKSSQDLKNSQKTNTNCSLSKLVRAQPISNQTTCLIIYLLTATTMSLQNYSTAR